METEWILRLALFGLVHWVLAGLMLSDLAHRERVAGGRKWPWALAIIFVACFGSLVYLVFHPQVFGSRDR
ncbi:MAG: PLDc N-terminal domain-containing protein [Chloroflexi bacterium]|nr:PLDc N-terminal domain-containing protein [Chloroflexota bacterium]